MPYASLTSCCWPLLHNSGGLSSAPPKNLVLSPKLSGMHLIITSVPSLESSGALFCSLPLVHQLCYIAPMHIRSISCIFLFFCLNSIHRITPVTTQKQLRTYSTTTRTIWLRYGLSTLNYSSLLMITERHKRRCHTEYDSTFYNCVGGCDCVCHFGRWVTIFTG